MDKVEEGGLGPLGDSCYCYLNCINLNGWLGFKGKIAYAGWTDRLIQSNSSPIIETV